MRHRHEGIITPAMVLAVAENDARCSEMNEYASERKDDGAVGSAIGRKAEIPMQGCGQEDC